MMKIKVIPKKQALPPDLPKLLRDMASRIEQGSITQMIIVYVEDDNYAFAWPSGLRDSLVLATLMHHEAINRMKLG